MLSNVNKATLNEFYKARLNTGKMKLGRIVCIYLWQLTKIMVFLSQFVQKATQYYHNTWVIFSFCRLFDKIIKGQHFAFDGISKNSYNLHGNHFFCIGTNYGRAWYIMWMCNNMLRNKNTGHCE